MFFFRNLQSLHIMDGWKLFIYLLDNKSKQKTEILRDQSFVRAFSNIVNHFTIGSWREIYVEAVDECSLRD